jgi:enoyl-CoA hydratase/carnithine racemase
LKEQRPKGGLKVSNQFYSRLETFRKVTIAAIEGHCLGGGLEMALCCDLRIASETANIGLPEVKVGSFPAGGGTFRLQRLIGLEKAKTLIYSGDPISGKEAFNIGLVGQLAEPGSALDEAKRYARSLTPRAPLSLITAKACLNAGINVGIDTEAYIQFVSNAYELLQKSYDYQEGRKAFKEKRKPVWRGE